MSSFFTLPASQRKRKRADERLVKSSKRRATQPDESQPYSSKKSSNSRDPERDSSISGSDSEVESSPDLESASESEATSEEDETPADRRVRLAQRYLDNIRQEVDETGFDAEDIDNDLIAERLKEDADEARGRQFRLIASSLDFAGASHCAFRADTQSTTAVAICPPYAYTVSKDKCLIKWEFVAPKSPGNISVNVSKKQPPSKCRPKQLDFVRGIRINASSLQQHGHTGPILSVAASPDGRYIATGGADKKLIIWAAETLKPLKTFPSHRDAVTGLSFAPISSQPGVGAQLFSASMDRTLKTYSLNGDDSLAYVETLFGHQDHVLSVASMAVDQCVSVGARDRTARLWRVVEETQLVFRGDSSKNDAYSTGNVECVAALPPAHFVTGSDSGTISLWNLHKKKPLFTVQTAHGVEMPEQMEDVTAEHDADVIARLKKDDIRRPIPRGITALTTVPGTDVVLSGSWDGWVRTWKLSDDKRILIPLGVVGKADGEISLSTQSTKGLLTPPNTMSGEGQGFVKGVINSLAVFERRKEIVSEFGGKKEGECLGLCIVAGTGKEMRLGRWRKFPRGKNGAMVFEVQMAVR